MTHPDDRSVDVLIVGAGLSGIGAAAHLRMRNKEKTFAILEARDAIGGTWDLFRYPGIRSDSDMFTLGYRFKVWDAAKAIADGPSILEYVRETAREHDIERAIVFNQRVVRAEWSSDDARWTVTAEDTKSGETSRTYCRFLYVCSGYYSYDEPYTPEIEGMERFRGEIFHPQLWPEEFDYRGKRVVVLGSGATAVTLVPAMATDAGKVTMLQRSPSYLIAMPSTDRIAEAIRKVLPARLSYAALRWKNVLLQLAFYRLSHARPKLVRGVLRRAAIRLAPAGYDVDTHLSPRYDPWAERPCLIPDGDLFRALKSGKAEIVTDRISTITETGIELESGGSIEADAIITATGLNLQALGGMSIAVDGEELSQPDAVGYKGMMVSGVPNMAMTLGYTNASWTLKADLVSEYVCRLLDHMDRNGFETCTPKRPDPSQPLEPFITNLDSGYIKRKIAELPKQGTKWPWKLHQNYIRDVLLIRHGPVEDEAMVFGSRSSTVQGNGRPAGEILHSSPAD